MTARRARGEARTDQVVRAAAGLLLEGGPAAVSHRAVAARAGASLSATTYYFRGLDDLLHAAATRVADGLSTHAETVARRAEKRADRAGDPDALAADLLDAVLPGFLATEAGDEPAATGVTAHEAAARAVYEHLVAAGRSPTVAAVYASGRVRVDDAVRRVLAAHGCALPASLAVAVVDGAAVAALSEGRPLRPHVGRVLGELLVATRTAAAGTAASGERATGAGAAGTGAPDA